MEFVFPESKVFDADDNHIFMEKTRDAQLVFDRRYIEYRFPGVDSRDGEL